MNTYAIQVISRDNNARSPLIHGTVEHLADVLLSSVDNDSHKTRSDDYVIVILEADEHGNELSAFSVKPLLTVDSFIQVMMNEKEK